MIIKKPYAFLIKNFRIIHGILFAMLFYISIKALGIYTFFSGYATTHTYLNTSNLASSYINYFIFFLIIISALISLVLYYLLTIKKKSAKTYLFIFLYMIILFVYYIIMFVVLQKLQTESLSVESVRVYRDISLMALLPMIIFTFMMLGRTLGFNVKQFNFKKDLEELEISVSDNEEVEVTLGNDTYKITRTLRKMLRLSKYFVLENRLFVIGFASLIILVISFTIFTKVNVYDVNYNTNDQIYANSLWFKPINSYTTTADISNKTITKGKTYVLVEVEVSNKLAKSSSLNRETFRLEVDGELLFPTFSLKEKFMDIGNMFAPIEIKSGEDKTFVIVYEVDSSVSASDYILKIKNYDSKTFGNIESEYKSIIISPIDIGKSKNAGIYKLSANLDFKDSILNNTKMNITKYEIADKYKEKYTYCIGDNCKEAIYTIIPDKVGKGNILILKLYNTLEMDKDLYMSKYIINPSDLLKYYGYLKYRYLGEYHTVSISPMSVKYNNDKYSYLEVPYELSEANKIELIIQVRGIKYTIVLK